MIDVRSASSMQPENNEFQPHPISPDVQVTNDAMINTLYVSRDGVHVITGDSKGAVKVWDVRARKFKSLVCHFYCCFGVTQAMS